MWCRQNVTYDIEVSNVKIHQRKWMDSYTNSLHSIVECNRYKNCFAQKISRFCIWCINIDFRQTNHARKIQEPTSPNEDHYLRRFMATPYNARFDVANCLGLIHCNHSPPRILSTLSHRRILRLRLHPPRPATRGYLWNHNSNVTPQRPNRYSSSSSPLSATTPQSSMQPVPRIRPTESQTVRSIPRTGHLLP